MRGAIKKNEARSCGGEIGQRERAWPSSARERTEEGVALIRGLTAGVCLLSDAPIPWLSPRCS